jgi:DASS family divalent anion:Na+ symporter
VYVAAILGIMLRPFPEAVIAVGVMGLASFFIDLKYVLNGYSNSVVWLVFSAFMISQAFVDTGLGRRIAFIMIKKFGHSALGLAYGAALTDLIISPATPSNTARTGGIVFPIYRSIAVALDSEPGPTSRRIGAYLSVLLYQISLATTVMFITAGGPNVLSVKLAKDILKVDISWFTWAQAALVPGLIVLLIIPYLVYKIYPPELKIIHNSKEIAQKGLDEMGPISSREKILAVLFVLAIIGWATSGITNFNATGIALAFLAISLFTKIVTWDSILSSKGAWSTLMWFGALVGLADSLANAKFFDWLASLFAKNMSLTGYDSYFVLAVLLVVSLVVRYIFASMTAFVTAFIPVLLTLGMVAQAPPLPLALLMAYSAAFGCVLTHYGGAVGPVLFGAGYVDQATWWKIGTVVVILDIVVFIGIGLPYWKLIGLW